MLNKLKIWILRTRAKYHYYRAERWRDNYDCGNHLLGHLAPYILHEYYKVNDLVCRIQKLEQITNAK